MAEIIVAIAIEVVKCVAKCIAPSAGRRISYLREYKSNFQNLKTEVEKLKDRRTSIQHEVDAAKRKVEEIEENVQKWLERAAEIEENFQKWLERASTIIPNDAAAERSGEDEQTAAKKPCFKGLCPDLKMRYRVSKEAVSLLETAVKHLEAGKFDKISYPIIPKDPRLSNKDYEAFESRASTLRNVISSLSDPDVNIVGIYGMGGIGKTTLAKEVANQPKAKKLFDSVIFVEVTEKPDEMKIQREIGEKLGLPLSQEESESTRAGKLCERLKAEKILVILDNIWAYLDLQEIGIPLGDVHKGCKVLLTARNVDLLSGKMGSQRNFPVHLLDDEEAWKLFKKMTGEYIEGSEFKSIATEVANKCARLPIVIVTIARALTNKPLFVWEDALQQMRMSSSENIQDIRASIELSYNYLASEVLRKTILLIRYANLTTIDELLIYGVGLGLFEGINKMAGRRVRVQTLVQQLKDSCLLLDSNTTGEDFSMHDVVRDAFISIASRDHVFTNELFDELEWPDENTLKTCTSIVLEDVEMEDLPQLLEAKQLKLLTVSATYSYSDSDSEKDSVYNYFVKIRDEFFTRTTELRVLVLAYMDLSSLPSSLCLLTNLRALGLHRCNLEDISNVGDLKKLEMFSIRNSEISQLPVEVGHLSRLKSLDLRSRTRLLVIAPNVISRLSNLEELYMGDFIGWDWEGLEKDRKNASLNELKHLVNLSCLEIKVKDAKTVPRDLFFKKLERYKISIGNDSQYFLWHPMSSKISRKFELSSSNTSICFNDGHIMQLKGIEGLSLGGLQDMKNVLYGLDRDGFLQLKYLIVQGNDNILYIVDSMAHVSFIAFPVLESLRIERLINLEKICRGQLATESFIQLREIKVAYCDKLENIFSLSIVRRLQALQTIHISDCKIMEEIFAVEREDESNSNSEVIENIKLDQLHSLALYSIPQLRRFCSKLKTTSVSQERQDEVILEANINVSNTFFAGEVVLPNLTKLILRDCDNLRCLFSSSIASSFVQLQHLEISQCQGLEEIVVFDGRRHVVFPQLQYLWMEGLKNLTKFCSCTYIEFPSLKKLEILRCSKLKEFVVGNMNMNNLTEIPLAFFNEKAAFPNLEELRVFQCDNLRCVFSSSMIRSLVRLQHLDIYSCSNLEVIFDHGEAVTQLSKLKISYVPKLKHIWNKDPKKFVSFQKLNTVRIVECNGLKNVFPQSVASNLSQLNSLEISRCGVEEIVFVADEGVDTITRFVFPRVTSLTLEDLPKYTTFFPGIYTMEWPALKELDVSGWEIAMNLFFQPQVMAEKVFPSLKRLSVSGKGIATKWQLPEELISKLKYLYVQFEESTTILSLDFLQRFHNVKMLQVGDCYVASRDEAENWMLAVINVDNCSNLKQILIEETNMDHLVHLKVYKCDSLINLVPSSTTFRNLTTLEVCRCNGLTNIITSSTAKTLVRLREIDISCCDLITELMAVDEEDQAIDHEIVFSELKKLTLWDLKCLTSFCSANCTLKFPSLEELLVNECPKMKSFSGGKLCTPKLQEVKQYSNGNRCWKGDLNTTIKELHEEVRKKVDQDENDVETENDEEDVAGSCSEIVQTSMEDSAGQPSTQHSG